MKRTLAVRNARNTLIMLALVGLVSGCSTLSDVTHLQEVKPWERNILAGDDMQLVTDSMEQSVDDHMYFSKEASTGGSGVQGGGCGCN